MTLKQMAFTLLGKEKKFFSWEREKEGKMIQLFSVKLVGINASGSEGHYFNPETICSECR